MRSSVACTARRARRRRAVRLRLRLGSSTTSRAAAGPGPRPARARRAAAWSMKLDAIWAVTTAAEVKPERHEPDGGDPTARGDGVEVAVADGGDGDARPPERVGRA